MGGGSRDSAWVIFFMDDTISAEVQCDGDGGRCMRLSQSLALIHFQAMGRRTAGEELLLSHKKVPDRETRQEVPRFDVNSEEMVTRCR